SQDDSWLLVIGNWLFDIGFAFLFLCVFCGICGLSVKNGRKFRTERKSSADIFSSHHSLAKTKCKQKSLGCQGKF
ncbi:MAG: hypothetical protein ACYTFK_01890, partial [Planctomycetota bacterium]